MFPFTGRAVAAALLLAFGSAGAAMAQGATTEALLKDSKLDYKVIKPGLYRIVLETQEGISTIGVEEVKLPWKDSKGNEQFYAQIFTVVAAAPADFKASTAMLGRLAELNDGIRFGSVGMSKEKDAVRFYRNSSMFLRNAGADQLADMIVVMHYDKFRLQKELKGFIDEGK